MAQLDRMRGGKLYDPNADGFPEMRAKAHDLCRESNALSERDERREEILRELLPKAGSGVYLQGPVQFDYGFLTEIGENTYANFNFTCIDCAPVKIGANVFFGPNVSILTPMHPLRYQDRNVYIRPDGVMTDREYAKPITIGENCWISGNVTICGGVTIGSGSVIGAGSVVTRDIPPNTLAVGVPCRPIREITEEDALGNHAELF